MGIKDAEEINRNLPVVHPVIKLSRDHFRRNTAFTDGRYRVLEKQRRAYEDAPEVNFDDVVGLVLFGFYYQNVSKTLSFCFSYVNKSKSIY